ncbi:MAG TPA: RDD family protein [Terriglobia bacterium]|nr:RDD family protein [Terriglobia bacterium]
MDHLTIETPEQVPLEFLLAGIGSRFLALALDTLIQAAATLLLVIAAAVIGITAAISHVSPRGGQTWTLALLLLLFFLVQFGYFAFFEALWNGQTPGKRYMHLRVIKDSGRPISTFDALGRNLLRLVDSLPGIYAVAIVSALLSAKNKRLGDYVAGTVVVHEKPLSAQADLHWESAPRVAPTPPPGSILKLAPPEPPPQPEPAAPLDSGYDVSRLSAEEFHLLETFLLRRRHLAADVRIKMANQIVERLSTKREISDDDRRGPEKLIERLANAYRRRGHLR